MTEGVFNCLIDRKRTLAFKKAINNTVKQGDVVADMGTGSGILAMFAADAGAKRVYAIELDKKNIKPLEQTFSANGYSDRIHVVKDDATKVALPEKVDVIIGEMIATGLIEELQIPAMNNLLKLAKPDTRVLLNAIENYADLVFNRDTYYGHSMKIIRYEYPGEPALKSIPLSNKVCYRKVDFAKPVRDSKVDEILNFEIVGGG